MFLAVEQEDLTRAIIAAIEAYARAHPGTTDEQVEVHAWKQGQFGVSSGTIRCQFIIIASLEGQFGVSSSKDNSVSVHQYCFP